MDFLRDLIGFMRERRAFWLVPVIVVLLLIGILVVFGSGSAVAPFIYSLF
jgi:competence protein ComGC